MWEDVNLEASFYFTKSLKLLLIGCLGDMRRGIKKAGVYNLRRHLTDSSFQDFEVWVTALQGTGTNSNIGFGKANCFFPSKSKNI